MNISKSNIAIAASLYILASCAKTPDQDGLGHHHSHENEIEHVNHNHNEHIEEHIGHNPHEHEHDHAAAHGTEITLEESIAEKFGVKTQIIAPSTFHEVLKVSGQIMPTTNERQIITATSTGILNYNYGITEGSQVSNGQQIASISAKGIAGGDPNASAKAAFDAAKRELDRITPLHEEGIVSTRDYNSTKALYDQALAAYSGGNDAGGSAIAASSGIIIKLLAKQGQYVTAGQPIAEISGRKSLTLRADVPNRNYNFLAQITTANFQTSYSDSITSLSQLNGKLLSNGNSSSASGAYSPVYFSFDNNGDIAPESFATVYLIGASHNNVLAVPVEAISEQQGNFYIFVKLGHGCYDKRPVTLGGSDGNLVEILSGLHPNDNVVIKGVTTVKLAETSGIVPEGHSHNH